MLGVCFSDDSKRSIVLELLAGGDLRNFMRESRPTDCQSSLSIKDMLALALDIARGGAYLEQKRFVHR